MIESMSNKPLDSRHSIDSCMLQLHSWRPFHIQATPAPTSTPSRTLDSASLLNPKPRPHSYSSNSNGIHANAKRPCLSDRATASFSVDTIMDMSKLTLIDDDKPLPAGRYTGGNNYRLVARKRRHRGSRSVSGRSSDRSGTRNKCCTVGASAAAYGTCSDFPVAVGTDSSGELFGNGDANWSSDVSEARNSRRDRDRDDGSGEKENSGLGFGVAGCSDTNGNESGYGSEPGYRGDAEFGYGDELDEEEDDARLLFWGVQLGAVDSKMEMVGENSLLDQKSHHRCRRRKHDCRMVDELR